MLIDDFLQAGNREMKFLCQFLQGAAPAFFLPDDLIPGRQLPADAGFLTPAFSVAGGRRYIKQLTGTVALNLLEQLFWKYVFPIQICHASAPFTVSFSVMAVTEHIRTGDPVKCGRFTFRLCCRQCLCIAEPPLYVCDIQRQMPIILFDFLIRRSLRIMEKPPCKREKPLSSDKVILSQKKRKIQENHSSHSRILFTSSSRRD